MSGRRDYQERVPQRHADVTEALVRGHGFDWLAERWGLTKIGAYQWAINNGVWTEQVNALNAAGRK